MGDTGGHLPARKRFIVVLRSINAARAEND